MLREINFYLTYWGGKDFMEDYLSFHFETISVGGGFFPLYGGYSFVDDGGEG